MTPIQEIVAERQRQQRKEGFTIENDNAYTKGELAAAASCYALVAQPYPIEWYKTYIDNIWPWARSWWKPTDHRRNLIKAAALIVAEIERIDRRIARENVNG